MQGSLGPRSPPRVLSVGVEPTRPKAPGLESGAYASFATRASVPRTGVEPVIFWLRTRRPADRPTRHRIVGGNRTRAARNESPDWPPAATTAQRSVRDSNPWSPARQAGVHSSWTDGAARMPVESNHTPRGATRLAAGRPATRTSSSMSGGRGTRTPERLITASRFQNGVLVQPDYLPVPRQGIEPCSPE